MKLKSTKKDRDFAPNVSFYADDEEGNEELVCNLDLGPDEQVVCETTLASVEEKVFYAGDSAVHKAGGLVHSTNPKVFRAITKHCKVIRNLEIEDGETITTGRQLVEHETHPILNDFIMEIFPKIMGTYTDVEKLRKRMFGEPEPKIESHEDEELSLGEATASELSTSSTDSDTQK